jgi:hypothetical protein
MVFIAAVALKSHVARMMLRVEVPKVVVDGALLGAEAVALYAMGSALLRKER